jgi:hypothetical protein
MQELQELEQLRLRAIAEGEALANRLAASIVLDASWFHCVHEKSASVRKLVEPLSSDPQLVEELARSCADAARTRLHSLLRANDR